MLPLPLLLLQVHLFDVDVPNGPVLMESKTTAPGDKVGGAAAPLTMVRLPAAMQCWSHKARCATAVCHNISNTLCQRPSTVDK
jgi:hypothetical protein